MTKYGNRESYTRHILWSKKVSLFVTPAKKIEDHRDQKFNSSEMKNSNSNFFLEL